jgi:putative FmdB family regulatory protein
MPIYEYACSNCGKTSDVIQRVNDPLPDRCELCGAQGTLSRVVSRSSFVLKGSGWYSDLYSSSKKDGGAKDGGGTKGETSSTPTKETAPTKTESKAEGPSSAPAPAATSAAS